MQHETPAQETTRPAADAAPAPAPSLADILRLWQAQGKIEIIPLSTVAAELTRGTLSPLVEEIP
jgi:hypothetical protein